MRLVNLLYLYRVRLRARLLQEGFAVVGIAAGVALLFASQVASESLSGSAAQLSRGIVGSATLQLLARDSHGFDERMLGRVRAIPGVTVAAPLLEANANAIGPRGSGSVELVGADETLKRLGGALVRHTELEPFGGFGAIVLPAPLAHSIGITKFGAEATLQVAGRSTRAPLYSTLSARQIGPLIDSPIVVAPLSFAQEIAGLGGRVSRVLVAPAPGREFEVRAALVRLAGGRLNVESTGYDEQLFAKAAAASNQSTLLFAVISALVGFLFAFNAMLLTVPQRRRLIADLRRDGYTPRVVVGVLLFDAVALGVVGCVLGLVLGDELSIHLFHANPGYLSSAFAVGSARVVSVRSVAVAGGGGMFAAVVAVLSPLRDILARDPLAAVSGGGGVAGSGFVGWRVVLGGVCLVVALVVLWVVPGLAVVGMVGLALALLLLLELVFCGVFALVGRVASWVRSVVPHLAVMELRGGRSRVVAVAATGAVAVFGSVSIQGARRDLERGLEGAARDMNAFTDVWVSPAGEFNLLMTQPFSVTSLGRLERLRGVRAVRLYRGGLLDWGQRRVWVIAPPVEASPFLPASQIVGGGVALASGRVRGGGWVVLSGALASEHRLRVGEAFLLPSPRPAVFRLAAVSSNVGWAPGVVIMGAGDFAWAWGSSEPSAYNVLLARGVSPVVGRREVEGVLGRGSGLAVQTAGEHAGGERLLAREGLGRLTQIASLILIVAVLAMAAATGGMIWQRRPRFARLRLEGFSAMDLWATLLFESVLLLVVGCVSGAVFGLLGQQLLDRALAASVDYPVVRSVAVSTAAGSIALVTVAAAVILSVPGYLAARVPAAVALEE